VATTALQATRAGSGVLKVSHRGRRSFWCRGWGPVQRRVERRGLRHGPPPAQRQGRATHATTRGDRTRDSQELDALHGLSVHGYHW